MGGQRTFFGKSAAFGSPNRQFCANRSFYGVWNPVPDRNDFAIRAAIGS
jgi:hypothetical protein